MNELLFKHLESESENVHFISLAYSILNNVTSADTYFKTHKKIINSIELLKASTLIIDDIIDSTKERNFTKSLVAEYGINKSILLGEQLKSHSSIAFIESLKELPITEKQILQCYLIFEDSFRTVSSGQLDDIENLYYREEMNNWTLNDWKNYNKLYFSVIYKTTSVFIQIPFNISNVLGSINNKDYLYFLSYFKNIGVAYQLRDDILDAVGDSSSLGKYKGGDIIEKKIRIPLIEYFKIIKQRNEKNIITTILLKDVIGTDDIESVVSLLYNAGAIDNSIIILNQYCQSAINSISKIEDLRIKKLLINLAEFIIL